MGEGDGGEGEKMEQEKGRGESALQACVSDVIRKCLTRHRGQDRDRWGRPRESKERGEGASRRTASDGRSMTSREFARDYRTPVAWIIVCPPLGLVYYI